MNKRGVENPYILGAILVVAIIVVFLIIYGSLTGKIPQMILFIKSALGLGV